MKKILPFIVLLGLLLAGCNRSEPQPTTIPVTQPSTEAATEPAPTETQAPATTAPEPKNEDFVRIVDYIPTLRQSLAYATTDNFTGQVIYDFTDAYLRYGTVKKLQKVCEELEKQDLGLLIWDGYRPVSAQAKLWEVCPDPTYVSPPGTGVQSHCRGVAVDVTLVDLETGEPLLMPTGFDDFTTYADRDYSDVDPIRAENALLLEEIMERHGFVPYRGEWWHFSDREDYPIEETFYPE